MPRDTQNLRDRSSAIRGQSSEDIRFRKVGNGPGGPKTLEGKGGPGPSFPGCKKSGSAEPGEPGDLPPFTAGGGVTRGLTCQPCQERHHEFSSRCQL